MDPAPTGAMLPMREIDVDFTAEDGNVPHPRADIHAAGGNSGAAPRDPARHLRMEDDGKLFEGHLTVQSRNLKSIMQYLVDSQAEQTLRMNDLQDQVHTLRAKLTRANRGGGGGGFRGGAGGGPMEVDELQKRVKALERFLTLWGIRPADVQQLVEAYGDPVITPDEYNAYLLELPAFKVLRREVHGLVAAGGNRPTITPEMMATAADTAGRRSKAGQETEDDGSVARQAMEVAAEALRQVERLGQGGGKSGGESSGGGGGSSVDAQARSDIEQLANYVDQRLKELEAHGAGGQLQHPRRTGGQEEGDGAPRAAPPAAGDEVVDVIAREDAAASLDMIEELERIMERRFKELASSIAGVALRKNQSGPAGPAGAPAEPPAAAPEKPEKPEKAPLLPTKPKREKERPSLPSTSGGADSHQASVGEGTSREDIEMLAGHMEDLENDINRRWQTLEERLRIIGRASMNRPAGNAPAASIDRKAREDASASLARTQQVEREVAALKQQLASLEGRDFGSAAAAADGSRDVDLAGMPEQREAYQNKVRSLEQDVESRLAEVNRAIVLLRNSQGARTSLPGGLANQQMLFQQDLAAAPLAAEEASGGAAATAAEDGAGPSRVVLHSNEAAADDEEPGGGNRAVLQLRSAALTLPSWPGQRPNLPRGTGTSGPSPAVSTAPADGAAAAHSSAREVMLPAATEAPAQPVKTAPGCGSTTPPPPPPAAADARQLLQQTAVSSSLGHTKPCVVLNCAWCEAERQEQRRLASR